jgi:hypothetical protein
MTISLNKHGVANVPERSPALLERAEAGTVTREEFISCIRQSLPFAWSMVERLVTETRSEGSQSAQNKGWLVGTGVAATYPVLRLPGLRRGEPRSAQPRSAATIRAGPDGRSAS